MPYLAAFNYTDQQKIKKKLLEKGFDMRPQFLDWSIELTPQEKRLLETILDFVQVKPGWDGVYPSVKTLAYRSQMSLRNCHRVKSSLKQKGYLSWVTVRDPKTKQLKCHFTINESVLKLTPRVKGQTYKLPKLAKPFFLTQNSGVSLSQPVVTNGHININTKLPSEVIKKEILSGGALREKSLNVFFAPFGSKISPLGEGGVGFSANAKTELDAKIELVQSIADVKNTFRLFLKEELNKSLDKESEVELKVYKKIEDHFLDFCKKSLILEKEKESLSENFLLKESSDKKTLNIKGEQKELKNPSPHSPPSRAPDALYQGISNESVDFGGMAMGKYLRRVGKLTKLEVLIDGVRARVQVPVDQVGITLASIRMHQRDFRKKSKGKESPEESLKRIVTVSEISAHRVAEELKRKKIEGTEGMDEADLPYSKEKQLRGLKKAQTAESKADAKKEYWKKQYQKQKERLKKLSTIEPKSRTESSKLAQMKKKVSELHQFFLARCKEKQLEVHSQIITPLERKCAQTMIEHIGVHDSELAIKWAIDNWSHLLEKDNKLSRQPYFYNLTAAHRYTYYLRCATIASLEATSKEAETVRSSDLWIKIRDPKLNSKDLKGISKDSKASSKDQKMNSKDLKVISKDPKDNSK